jgi:hypothetical protein
MSCGGESPRADLDPGGTVAVPAGCTAKVACKAGDSAPVKGTGRYKVSGCSLDEPGPKFAR